jgi:hypothetical protein
VPRQNAAEPTQKSHNFPSSQLNRASTVTEQFMTIFIKEHWATPNRATPKSCYPFKKSKQIKKNSTNQKHIKKNQSNNSKRNSKPQKKKK